MRKHFSFNSPLSVPNGWTRGKRIAECGHRFVQAKGFFQMCMQNCGVCTKSVGINKCLQCTGNNSKLLRFSLNFGPYEIWIFLKR